MRTRRRTIKLSKKQAKYQQKISAVPVPMANHEPRQVKVRQTIVIPKLVTVRQLANALSVSPAQLLAILLKNGLQVHVNQSIDYETAALVAEELGFPTQLADQTFKSRQLIKGKVDLRPRPPVVTVMGHVDHGKTTLLDALRKTNLAQTETGGITQHIGAYQVDSITFLDTPGHEAFSTLRAHGASLTDIIVLVVAANEGVKPQTIEAIAHARAANLPIVVVITKIDLANANPEGIRQQLGQLGIKSDQQGGETPYVEISAPQKRNLDELLEVIKLIAQLKKFEAPFSGPATGVVVESEMKVGIGPVSTIIVQEGNLATGDHVVFESTSGKIRTMTDWQGQPLNHATPSTPVRISGIKNLPKFGERFQVAANSLAIEELPKDRSTLTLSPEPKQTNGTDSLPIIIKTDTTGSLETIRHLIDETRSDRRQLSVIFSAVGDVTESDIRLAGITGAWIVAFRVKMPAPLAPMVKQIGVVIDRFEIIYDLIEAIQKRVEYQQVDPVTSQTNEGAIIRVFRDEPKEAIVGVIIKQGVIKLNQAIRLMRVDQSIGTGSIESIKHLKTALTKANINQEVGIGIKKNIVSQPWSIKINDQIVTIPKS